METMLSALNNADNLKIKELAVSAIGAIGKTATKNWPSAIGFLLNSDTDSVGFLV